MHNDLGALPESLDAVVGLAHVWAQIVLADVVDGQDAGELCVSLLGAPLWHPLTPLCLPTPREAQGQSRRALEKIAPRAHTPAQLWLWKPWTRTQKVPWGNPFHPTGALWEGLGPHLFYSEAVCTKQVGGAWAVRGTPAESVGIGQV